MDGHSSYIIVRETLDHQSVTLKKAMAELESLLRLAVCRLQFK